MAASVYGGPNPLEATIGVGWRRCNRPNDTVLKIITLATLIRFLFIKIFGILRLKYGFGAFFDLLSDALTGWLGQSIVIFGRGDW